MEKSKTFEKKVKKVIDKYLSPEFICEVKPSLVFDKPEFGKKNSKIQMGEPDYAISYNNRIFLLIEATTPKKRRLIPSSGSKHKDMRKYSRNYLSVLVTNANRKRIITYFPPSKPLGYPHYYIMSISILGKFLQFLSSHLRSTLDYFFKGFSQSKVDSIIDDFITSITPKNQKCKLCGNRLVDFDMYFCSKYKEYITEMYADWEEGIEPTRKSHTECDGCGDKAIWGELNFEHCMYSTKIWGKQCRLCGAIFDGDKLVQLKEFDLYHGEHLEEDFDYYKKMVA